MIAFFPGSLPIKCIHVLENGDRSLARHLFVEYTRKMSGSEMRFPEKHQNCGVRMRLTDFPNVVSSMPIAQADLTQVFTRPRIEPIDSFRLLALSVQRCVK